MVVIGTIYDKSIKEKMFYVREVDRYSHSTSTSLNVDWSNGVFTLTAVVSNLLGKGYVKFYKDGVEIGEQYVNKTATLLYPSSTRDGVFVARFVGNSDCLKSESPETTANKLGTILTVANNGSTNKYVGDTVTVTCTLKDKDGNALSSAKVSDGVSSVSTNSNGVATFTYTNSNNGNVSKSYSYAGDDTYTESVGVTNWSIILIPTSITLEADKTNYYVDDRITITATVYDTRTNTTIPNASVDMNGTSETTDSNGQVTTVLSATTEGSYSFYAQAFVDDSKYTTTEKATVSYNVLKYDTALTITSDKTSYYVEESSTVTVTLKDHNNKSISGASVSDGVTTQTTNSNGVATFTYTNNTATTISKTYTYEATTKYNKCTGTVSYKVLDKIVTVLAVSSPSSVYVGETATVTATLKTSTGSVISGVTISDGTTTATTNGNGIATFTYPNTNSGTVSKTYSYDGAIEYAKANKTISYTVNKYTSTLTLTVDNSVIEVGGTVTITGLLKDNTGKVISDAQVTVPDGSTKTTGADGKFTTTYTCNTSGNWSKTFTYDGTSKYVGCNSSVSWDVNKINTVLTAVSDNSSYVVGGTATVTVTLKDNNSNLISEANVTDGITTQTTNTQGEAVFTYTNLTIGEQSKSYSYNGDSKYNGCTGDVSFNVVDKDVPVLVASADKTNYYVDEDTTVTISLKSSNGGVISGASVSDGSTTSITDDDGLATFTYTNTTSGSMSKTYTYDGDSEYASTSSIASWSVIKYDTVLTVVSDKESYYVGESAIVTATLKTSTGTVISDAPVIIDDETLTTDNNGQASKTFSCSTTGSITKSCDYGGSVKYGECTTSVSWSVKKYGTSLTLASDKESYEEGETATITATLTSEGSPVTNALVNVNGTDLTTDSNGQATLSYDCTSQGTVTLTGEYLGDDTYEASNGEVTFTIILLVLLSIDPDKSTYSIGEEISINLSAENLPIGASVNLINEQTGDILSTCTPDENGNGIFTYSSSESGILSLCAEYINETDIFKSNILNIDNCTIYCSMSDLNEIKSLFELSGIDDYRYMSMGEDSLGVYSLASSGYGSVTLNNIPSQGIIKFTYHPRTSCIFQLFRQEDFYYTLQFTSDNLLYHTGEPQAISMGDEIKIVYSSTQVNLFVNNIFLSTLDVPEGDDFQPQTIMWEGNPMILTMKDFKII